MGLRALQVQACPSNGVASTRMDAVRRRDLLLGGAGLALLTGCSNEQTRSAQDGFPAKSLVVPKTERGNIEPWMEGFPPPSDRIIRFADGSYAKYPQLRWSFSHIEELVPTKSVFRGYGRTRELEARPVNFDQARVAIDGEAEISFDQALKETATDGLLILHHGKIVFEKYFGHCDADTRHIIMSATKSFIGTIVEDLVQTGVLNREAFVPSYIPELKGTAWDNATLGMVLDMLVAMKFEENYLDANSEIYTYLTSAGMVPAGPKYKGPLSFYGYLPKIEKQGEHNQTFAYREPNINVLGWIVRRATGKSLADLFSERYWQRMGAQRDAYFMIDSFGAETSLCATLRDFALYGEIIRTNKGIDGKKVLNSKTHASIFKGGDQEKFAKANISTLKNWSYTSQWWVRHIEGRICPVARGAYGQFLYIDPVNEVVIAKFGSAQFGPSTLLDHITLPLIDTITAKLR